MAQTEAARVFGLARGTINGWVSRAKRQGLRTLRARRRGRPPRSRLAPHQAATAVRMICNWLSRSSRRASPCGPEAVQAPISLVAGNSASCSVHVERWTPWPRLGFDAAKTSTAAYERDPAAVRKWLSKNAWPFEGRRGFQAQIHWLDEMGLRSDHQAGRSYGRRGQTLLWSGDRAFPMQHDLGDH